MKIFISEKGYRPIEHLYGLIIMSLSDSSNEYFFDIKINKNIPVFLKKELEKTINSDRGFKKELSKLLCSDVYIGNPEGWKKLLIRIRCALFRKITLTIRPGKVTKSSGYFSKRKISLNTILKNFISNKILRNYVLVADKMDSFYCALAYGFPLDAMIVAPSPKVYLINYLLTKHFTPPPTLLIAPTHRRGKNYSPLEKLLLSDKFVKKITQIGFKISYSIHEDGFDIGLNSRVGIEKFDGDWSRISAILTDYSSIGADYYLAGGKHIEYYIEDKVIFESIEGNCEFFDVEISKHSFSNTPIELELNLKKTLQNLTKEKASKTEKLKRIDTNLFVNELLKIL